MSNEEKSDDIEAPLVDPPMEEESLESRWAHIVELRWASIRKMYSILAVQILATIAVTAGVAAYPSVAVFFHTTWGGWATYVAILMLATIAMVVLVILSVYLNTHPINFLPLAIFTVSIALLVGLAASFISAPISLQAATATVAVVVALMLYTFRAARRGEEFGFFTPFLPTLVVTLILFIVYMFRSHIHIYFPVGKISYMLYNGLFVVIFSIYIIYETDVLIQRMDISNILIPQRINHDQYIWASLLIYLDIPGVFLGSLFGSLLFVKAVICRC